MRTSTAEAPWIVVPGADSRYMALTIGKHLLASMRERLRVAMDGAFCGWDAPVREGAEIAFIPPVSGG